jgi:hypothetical protein
MTNRRQQTAKLCLWHWIIELQNCFVKLVKAPGYFLLKVAISLLLFNLHQSYEYLSKVHSKIKKPPTINTIGNV